MLHTWVWKRDRPPSSLITRYVWDDESKLLTGYAGSRVIRPPYHVSTAREWFDEKSYMWRKIDEAYEVDIGL